MTTEHRFVLEKYKGMNTRYPCPGCQKKRFVRYVDQTTGNHIYPDVGRCNRESNCGYHYTPKEYFGSNDTEIEYKPKPLRIQKAKPTSYIPALIFKKSLKDYRNNHFVTFINNKYGSEITNTLISKYFIGTSRYFEGATVFWQVDLQGRIRTGKIMQYNPISGKRVKDPYDKIQWAHNAIKQPDFELKQCFYGEHLLNDKTRPVAIVESEKTAIISRMYLPEFIWLACGALTGLNEQKCNVLTGRTIVLFPDLKGLEKWSEKAEELSHVAKFTVSDLLERKATPEERTAGLDLADYLLNFDPETFKTVQAKEVPAEPTRRILLATMTIDEDGLQIEDYYPDEPEEPESASSHPGRYRIAPDGEVFFMECRF